MATETFNWRRKNNSINFTLPLNFYDWKSCSIILSIVSLSFVRICYTFSFFSVGAVVFCFIQMKVFHWFVWTCIVIISLSLFRYEISCIHKIILYLFLFFWLLLIYRRDSCVCLLFLYIFHSTPPPTPAETFNSGIQYNSVIGSRIKKMKERSELTRFHIDFRTDILLSVWLQYTVL